MRVHFENNGQDLMWLDIVGDTVVDTNCDGVIDAIWNGAKVQNILPDAFVEAELTLPNNEVVLVVFQDKVVLIEEVPAVPVEAIPEPEAPSGA